MNKIVLVIEDSPSYREVLRLALERQGYTVLLAADGPQAMAILPKTPLAAVLCDLNLPGKDGFDVMAELRQLPAHRFTPIVVLTTESRDEAKDRGRALGVRAWMVKPFQPGQLVEVLRRVIG